MVQAKWDVGDETDVAATLRSIAANSDEITGKILKKCNKAASKGLSHIEVEIKQEDYYYLSSDTKNPKYAPPFVERLESLGFKLEVERKDSAWNKFCTTMTGYGNHSYNYYMTVRW